MRVNVAAVLSMAKTTKLSAVTAMPNDELKELADEILKQNYPLRYSLRDVVERAMRLAIEASVDWYCGSVSPPPTVMKEIAARIRARLAKGKNR